jgi:hypothetical protein
MNLISGFIRCIRKGDKPEGIFYMIEFKIGTVDIANLFPHYFKAVVTFTL